MLCKLSSSQDLVVGLVGSIIKLNLNFQTKVWQKMDKEAGKWGKDETIRVLVRQARVNF